MSSVLSPIKPRSAVSRQDPNRTLRRFQPRLALGHQDELFKLTQQLELLSEEDGAQQLSEAIEEVDRRVSQLESQGLSSDDLEPTLRWSAALRVLRDLYIQGWTLHGDDEGLLLKSPGTITGTSPQAEKEALRRSFAFARDAQLTDPSTGRFIRKLEQNGVQRLFAEGPDILDRLRKNGPAGIEPELELIDPGARDPGSGLLLQDVWRYARHFWSIPYQSTPGRNMFYLVRDGAAADRPLIGIAALGNPVLGLSQRDDYAGWSAAGFQRRWLELGPRKRKRLAERLLDVLEEGIAETFDEDLWPQGKPEDWRDAVAQLEEIERASAGERAGRVNQHAGPRDEEYLTIRSAHTAVQKANFEEIDWRALATTALYRRKRAGTLADLIRARGTLLELGAPRASFVESALAGNGGRRAIETALRRIKQSIISNSVMELITCGAVPPYREVLGGKLVSMMMLSRTVAADYEQKYSEQVSLIASALAARPVIRPTRLGWLTTSSLYAIGSSQYNRLKLKLGSGSLSYERIGMTESFGTVHFAPDTIAALGEVVRLGDSNRRRINNLFGEGTSPKMRLVRDGLASIGLDANVFLRHHSPRLLYGAALCSNLPDLLLGLSDKPRYLLPPGRRSTEIIVDYWRERWLTPRIKREDVLERVESQRVDDFLLGREPALNEPSDGGQAPVAERNGSSDRYSTGSAGGESTFVERLYRSTNSYADRLSQEDLKALHVDLGVDGYLLEEAEALKQIVITGNPGDGKTHLIERLRSKLEGLGAEVITDANACSDTETLDTWERCRKESRPFVLAINEWPLYVLQREAVSRGFPAVNEALRQVRSARYFVDRQKPAGPQENVITIDLALRNLLAPSVVRSVIARLTDFRFYAGLEEGDPMLANREALMDPQVMERLTKLLETVGLRLGHITMRQLVGFLAFLLSGGQAAPDRLRTGQDPTGLAYSNLAFEGGEGQLFARVSEVLDPAVITHPIWDERIWRGETDSGDWLRGGPTSVLNLPPSGRAEGFRALKRRFFFEHVEGQSLFDLIPGDETEFSDLLVKGGVAAPSLVRSLVLALNRFYEPDFPEKHRDRLLLWQSHRYDVRAPAAFVCLHDLPHQQLRIESMRYADWVERWLPPEQQLRRSFALVAELAEEREAVLELDRELYLTLLEAQRGLGRSSWSRTATRRVTRFIDQLDRGAEPHGPSPVEDVRVRNVATDLDEQFSVQRDPAKFQL
jgi:hypothetical protein